MGGEKSKPAEKDSPAHPPLTKTRFEPIERPRLVNRPPPVGGDPASLGNLRMEPSFTTETSQREPSSSKLRRPQDQRPIELSWLHQNHTNERYKHADPVVPSDPDNDYLHRRRIAIKRWQDDAPESETTKTAKSFFDEYIHP